MENHRRKYQLTRLTQLSLFDAIVQKVAIDEVFNRLGLGERGQQIGIAEPLLRAGF